VLHAVRYGPDALLLRFAESSGIPAYYLGRTLLQEIRRNPPAGLIECVPGFTTLLLRFHPDRAETLTGLARQLARDLADVKPVEPPEVKPKEILVRYDGEDLPELARAKSLSVPEVIRLHSEPVYQVCLLGFAPGFPYLGELDPLLHTPRRATPRPRVPAGSVAIGGAHTGIYSVDSPGGWHIIGHTDVPLFLHAKLTESSTPADVFYLQPGDQVRFRPVTGSAR